jgi:hypothetical protein
MTQATKEEIAEIRERVFKVIVAAGPEGISPTKIAVALGRPVYSGSSWSNRHIKALVAQYKVMRAKKHGWWCAVKVGG